jgi:uncharacterized protein YoxC
MQQMIIMMRPLMEHLQQTDATAEYTQHTVQRLSMDVSEVRSDLERANRYLAILRQGLGLQNEGRCMLQRGVENAGRATKRLDEQMEGMLDAMRGTEETMGRLASDARSASTRHDDILRQVAAHSHGLEDLQSKVERVSSDTHSLKDDILSSEARLEVWHRDLRELRRQSLGIMQGKLEDKCPPPPSSQSCRALSVVEPPWPQKKNFSAMEVAAGSGKDSSGFSTANGSDRGTSSSKRISRVSTTRDKLLPQDHLDYRSRGDAMRTSAAAADTVAEQRSVDLRSSSRAGHGNIVPPSSAGGNFPPEGHDEGTLLGACDEASSSSRLPLLMPQVTRQSGATTRPPDNSYSEGPRLRFSATMAKPESRGSPN